MTNNDILRLIHSTFNLNDANLIEIFSLADFTATQEQITAWLIAETDKTFSTLKDIELAVFLNGFINLKRGKREGEQPQPEAELNNNMVFQKLRIALNLKAEDILAIFEIVGLTFTKHELGAFFRKPDNKHFRACKDQTLQSFLQGYSMSIARQQ